MWPRAPVDTSRPEVALTFLQRVPPGSESGPAGSVSGQPEAA